MLLIPGFLNHAALFREAEVLRPPGQYNFCGARKYQSILILKEGVTGNFKEGPKFLKEIIS